MLFEKLLSVSQRLVNESFHKHQIKFYFRLNTGSKNGYTGSIFNQADSNSKPGMVFKNNMDNSSFNLANVSIFNTVKLPNQAYFGRNGEILENNVSCEVTTAMKGPDIVRSLSLGR